MMASRFLELHILHNVPASRLNSNEDGEPKTLTYGNVVRACVSSQCWKHAVRHTIEEQAQEYATRTRNLPYRLTKHLIGDGWPPDLAAFAAAEVARCAGPKGLAPGSDPQATATMLYLPADVLTGLAALCQTHRHVLTQAAKEAADRTPQTAPDTPPPAARKPAGKKRRTIPDTRLLPTADVNALLTDRTGTINLLGRMLTDIPGGTVSGTVDLAPAFSVHAADPQPDWFTAVEDWPRPGTSGSAHMDTAYFTTATLYRYACLNITDLQRNTGDLDHARRLTALFTEAFILSMPQAKRTSTAPHTLPHLVHYTIRDRRPVSYAPAFEPPVKAPRAGGYTTPAIQTLCAYAAATDRLLGTAHRHAHGYTSLDDGDLPLGTAHRGYDDLIATCTTAAFTPTPPPAAGSLDTPLLPAQAAAAS
jgi:CRISPR system Cascade subunit CasC